jgi:hypothetical protein
LIGIFTNHLRANKIPNLRGLSDAQNKCPVVKILGAILNKVDKNINEYYYSYHNAPDDTKKHNRHKPAKAKKLPRYAGLF